MSESKSVLTQSAVRTGIVTSSSAKGFNAKKQAASQAAAAVVKGKQFEAPKGGYLYEALGDTLLSVQCGNHFIDFVGGFYPTADEEEMECLEYFIKQGRVAKHTEMPTDDVEE